MNSLALTTSSSVSTSRTNDLLTILGASLFIAVCSQIKIPLFFTPVPLSLQTFAVLLVGCLLGSKRGALAVVAYLCEAIVGLPVLSSGMVGVALLGSSTIGYLVGFVVQAYLAGLYMERSRAGSKTTFLALCGLCAVQLGLGAVWLGTMTGWQAALVMGIYPFLPGEVLKSLAVTVLVQNRKDAKSVF